MKIRNSLRSLKKRDKDCRVIRRRGRTYVINKKNPRFKARQRLISLLPRDLSDRGPLRHSTALALFSLDVLIVLRRAPALICILL